MQKDNQRNYNLEVFVSKVLILFSLVSFSILAFGQNIGEEASFGEKKCAKNIDISKELSSGSEYSEVKVDDTQITMKSLDV